MKITFKLSAGLSDYLPEGAKRNSVEIGVQSGETVHQVIDRCRVPREQAHVVLVNGVFIDEPGRDSSVLKAGDTLSIWPPVAGG